MFQKHSFIGHQRGHHKMRRASVGAIAKSIYRRANKIIMGLRFWIHKLIVRWSFASSLDRLLARWHTDYVESKLRNCHWTGWKEQAVSPIMTGIPRVDSQFTHSGPLSGGIIEISGQAATGKTGLALHFVGAIQRQGGTAVYIGAEHPLHTQYFRNAGGLADRLIVLHPQSAEDAFQMIFTLMQSRAVELIVVDSISALYPRHAFREELDNRGHWHSDPVPSRVLTLLATQARYFGVTVVLTYQCSGEFAAKDGSDGTGRARGSHPRTHLHLSHPLPTYLKGAMEQERPINLRITDLSGVKAATRLYLNWENGFSGLL